MISAPLRSLETGQPAFAPSAAFLKSSSEMPGTLAFSVKRAALHRPAGAVLLDRHDGGRPQFIRLVPCPAEAEGKRHVEAAGMRGGEQLFRVGALVVAEAHAWRE